MVHVLSAAEHDDEPTAQKGEYLGQSLPNGIPRVWRSWILAVDRVVERYETVYGDELDISWNGQSVDEKARDYARREVAVGGGGGEQGLFRKKQDGEGLSVERPHHGPHEEAAQRDDHSQSVRRRRRGLF